MAQTVLLGLEKKAFRYSASAFVEMTNVRDVSLSGSKTVADTSRRANQGYKTQRGALKDQEVSFQMLYSVDLADYTLDPDIAAMLDSYTGNTPVKMRFMDGPDDEGNGWEADYEVFQFDEGEPLEDANTIDITLRPVSKPLRVTAGVLEGSMSLVTAKAAKGGEQEGGDGGGGDEAALSVTSSPEAGVDDAEPQEQPDADAVKE